MNFNFQKTGDGSAVSATSGSITTGLSAPGPAITTAATTIATTATTISLQTTTTSSACTTSTTSAITSTTITVSAAPTATSLTLGAKPNVQACNITFAQLEENINKWTIELEEQEKVFMNQVAHINEWDRLLLTNGDKIVSLNHNVEKVKLEQQQLDHELDFIVAQQRELEECLLPLEKEMANVNVSDPDRDAMFLIVQIGRILNAHMNSLQWVDQNTAVIKEHLDQVTKLTEMHRRENDSTQHL
ncbi:conserved hypothetical protein [Pediculus humanus corporis]|uniref:Nucleoporin NSP1-like C-terminal domain-containing protein n=1 Tax=Pediculus humanus subsp. corporis TaxID=121224 RepID=E0VQW1_PEDHC|nr:uncharacterized protein Phum_PHUM387820 [Pediculus humanus corporis]EEB15767.1 conserved hypothetical protein [Pediculus humanus corporis]